MKKFCMVLGLASGLIATAAKANIEFDDLTVFAQAQAAVSTASTTGDPGGTVEDFLSPPTSPILDDAMELARNGISPDPSYSLAEASIQGNVTPYSADISLNVLATKLVLPGDTGIDLATIVLTYTFTSTTGFYFTFNSTTDHSPGVGPGSSTQELLKNTADSGVWFVSDLSQDRSYASPLLPAGQYEFFVESKQGMNFLETDTSDSYWDSSKFDFAIAPQLPAVPESASWSMFIGGLSLVGSAMRRRRHADKADIDFV